MRREDLYRATGAVVLVRCETQRGWDRYDHLIDDSGAAAVEGREYPSAAKAIAAAAGACDGPYLFVELLWTSGPRAGEVWTVGNEPRLAGRAPVYSPSRHALVVRGDELGPAHVRQDHQVRLRLRDATSAEVDAARRGERINPSHVPAWARCHGVIVRVEGPGAEAWRAAAGEG